MKRPLLTILIFLLAGAFVNIAVAWTCALTIDPLDVMFEEAVSMVFDEEMPRNLQIDPVDVILEDAVSAIFDADRPVKVHRRRPFHAVSRWSRPGGVVVRSTRFITSIPKQTQGEVDLLLGDWTGFQVPTPECWFAEAKGEARLAQANGWPMLTLWCETFDPSLPRRDTTDNASTESVARSSQHGDPRPTDPENGGVAGSVGKNNTGPSIDSPSRSFRLEYVDDGRVQRGPAEPPHDGGIATGRLFTGPMARGGPAWSYSRALPLRPIWLGFAVNTIFYAAILWLLIPGPFALRRLIRRRRGLCPKCAYPMGDSEVCTECGRELPSRARPAT
jgi:hypothetical protein